MSIKENILWIPKFTPCNKCQNGFIVKDGVGKKCECKIKYDQEINFILSLIDSNILQEFSSEYQYTFFKEYTLNKYKGPDEGNNKNKIEKFIKDFDNKFNSINLFFYGEPGTQKTILSKYIVCSLVKKEKTGYYIIANDLFNLLTDSERNEKSRIKLKNILLKDILIIDEFDEDKITLYSSDWKQKFILPFLKKRLESIRKSTIFVSNRNPSNLGEKFDGAIQDLIERETEGRILIFKDKYSKYKEKINIEDIWKD